MVTWLSSYLVSVELKVAFMVNKGLCGYFDDFSHTKRCLYEVSGFVRRFNFYSSLKKPEHQVL